MQALTHSYQLNLTDSGMPKVLVVDDRAENRLVLRQILKNQTLQIVEADSGNAALSAVLHNDFALILLDVQMPEMDGLEVLEILRDDPLTQHIPIILITADHHDNARYIKAYKKGAVDFLYKPINSDVLTSKIKVFIDLYNSQLNFRLLSLQHELILSSAGEGICGLSLNGQISFANPTAERIAEKQLTGLKFFDLLHNAESQPLFDKEKDLITSAIAGKQSFRSDNYSIKTTNGYHVPISFSLTPINEKNLQDLSTVVVFSDITESKKLERRLTKLARYDSLTGLANRTLFYENLSKAIARAQRQRSKFALFFIDLDQFKKINDTLGHAAGDMLLVQAAQRLETVCREEDNISRIGGDEFTVIMEDIYSYQGVQKIAQKLLGITHEPIILGEHEHVITMSIGVAVYPDAGTDIETLTRNADTAMYRAKDTGRNNFQFFNKGLISQISNKVKLEHRLRRAVKNNEFELFYQPKINLNTGKITGLEALIRWFDPEKGYIYPDEFIPIAEETGMIIPIGEWVISEACEQKTKWSKLGFPKGLKIAVNLSAYQLNKKDFIYSFAEILKNLSYDKTSLEIEITETAVMDDVDRAAFMLNKVHDMGVSVAIDDFGIGYSSLSQLKCLPVDTLKIDKSFIRDIANDNNDAAIVKAIINMAKSLELGVVAEGIESQQQLDMLLDYDCLEGQGFHFSKPLAAKEITLEMFD